MSLYVQHVYIIIALWLHIFKLVSLVLFLDVQKHLVVSQLGKNSWEAR